MIPIALQLYTVREDLVEDPVRTIEAVAEIGYQGVEGGAPTGMSNKDYLSLLNDNNLTLIGSGTSTTGLRDRLPETVENCAELGINTLMCGIGGELHQSDGDWKRVVAELAEGCAKASEVGLRILYHNHAFEFNKLPSGKMPIECIFAHNEKLKYEIDLGWVVAGKADPIFWTKKYASRIVACHLKDFTSPDLNLINHDSQCAVGDGFIDWSSILNEVKKTDCEIFVLEHDDPKDYKEYTLRSIENLKDI